MKAKYLLIGLALALVGSAQAQVYVIDYESYEWNPCSGNTCLAINCGFGGCHTEGKHIVCGTESCITGILDQYGTDHLVGIWKIDYVNKTSKKMQYSQKYRIESELK